MSRIRWPDVGGDAEIWFGSTRRVGRRGGIVMAEDGVRTSEAPPLILEVQNLRKYFPIEKGLLRRVRGHVRAVDGVTLSLHEGRTLGLV